MPKTQGKIPFLAEFMLSFLPQEYLAKKMNLLAVKLGKRGLDNHVWAAVVKVAAQSMVRKVNKMK
jgi:hypothetical protein